MDVDWVPIQRLNGKWLNFEKMKRVYFVSHCSLPNGMVSIGNGLYWQFNVKRYCLFRRIMSSVFCMKMTAFCFLSFILCVESGNECQ